MVRDAKALVPRDQGDLADTIHKTELRERADGKSVQVFVVAGDSKETAEAAFRSEYGRAPGGSGKVDMSDHPGHRSQEFMHPAYWKNRKRARNRIKRAIAAAAKEAARGG